MRITILLVALATFCPVLANAACSDDAAALARKYGIVTELPSDAPAPGATRTEQLAKSGGVIAPPSTGDQSSVTPALPNPDNMQTAPSITPQTAGGDTANPGKTAKVETSAAADSQAASLLQAAQAAGAKGDEAACRQRLADARPLLSKFGN